MTGKKLLQKGQLQTRVTIIPLNKISGRSIDANTVRHAENIVSNFFEILDGYIRKLLILGIIVKQDFVLYDFKVEGHQGGLHGLYIKTNDPVSNQEG